MSTTLLTDRQRTISIHPPDISDRQTLTIPSLSARRRLAPADRLRLRLALWLLERADRTRATAEALPRAQHTPITEHQAITLLTFDLQKGLR